MAGAGFKTFGVGDVLTASDVNTYLMQQSVMRFADDAARTSAIGTGVLAEGMVSYLVDTDAVEVYDGSAWVGLGGGFTASTAITATDASWSVPTLADPVVRVTVVGGGGGGAAAGSGGGSGSNGVDSSFACSAGTATGAGGLGGPIISGQAQADGLRSFNGGEQAYDGNLSNGGQGGQGGAVVVAYLDLDGVATASVTVGAGGAGGPGGPRAGSDGGDGVVIVEYRAG